MGNDNHLHPNVIDADAFLKKYMPIDETTLSQVPNLCLHGINPTENTLLTTLFDRITSSRLLPGYQLLQSKNLEYDPGDNLNLSGAGHGPWLVFPPGNDPWKDPATSWHALEMHIRVISDNGSDCDPMPTAVKGKKSGRYSYWGHYYREDTEKYVSSQFARQHRLFAFSLVIFGRYARLLLWDRSGCMATTRFSYVKTPWVLAEFLWRFARLNCGQRGYDPTVSDALPRENQILKRAVRAFIKNSARDASFLQPTLSNEYPTYRIRVTEPMTGEQQHDLIIGKPFYKREAIQGPATKVFAAYSKTHKRVVILKDSWYYEQSMFLAEPEVYAGLEGHSVPHVPKCMFIGAVEVDGRRQLTCADPKRGMWHQRTIQDILFPIKTVTSSKELTQVVRDATKALSVAYRLMNILHQDISLGNVMVAENGHGVLADWGCAMSNIPGYTDVIHHTPVGTWPFLSIKLLQKPWEATPREIHDDLESFFWILLWLAASHIKPIAYWPRTSWDVFYKCYETRYADNGTRPIDILSNRGVLIRQGGRKKREFITETKTRRGTMCDMKWRCQPFNTLLFELKRVFGGVTTDPKTTREQDLVTYSQTPLKISLPSPWVSPEPIDHVEKREERRQNAKVQHGFLANPENLVRLFDEALAKED